jgi:hypothetical protein
LTACGGGGSVASTTTTTVAAVADFLSVNSTSPVDGATQKSDFPIVVVFSEPVDTALVDNNSFAVTDGVTQVTGAFSFSADNTVVMFTPQADLADGVSYTVTLSVALASVTGKGLAADVTWSFVANAKTNYACVITSPPASLNLDPYYTKYCDANGMPVIGGSLVSAAALQTAWLQTMNMMKMRQDLLAEMIRQGTKVAIVADGEGITQIPEYSDLDIVFPITGGWDARARGLGATVVRPISSGAEENVLCFATDPYYGENIFIHEFSHSVEQMALSFAEPQFFTDLTNAYNAALAAGLFANTYADDTVYEYWAEGVQDWFDINLEAIPSDGIHNEINTRIELQAYDPVLYGLISRVFPADWKPVACP